MNIEFFTFKFKTVFQKNWASINHISTGSECTLEQYYRLWVTKKAES